MIKLSDPAAERGILAGIYKYGYDGLIDINDIVNVDTFTIDSNKFIFKCLQHILENNHNAKIDETLLYSAANSLGIKEFLNNKVEQDHLRGIVRFPVQLSSVRLLGKKIKKLEIARDIIDRIKVSEYELGEVRGDETLSEIIGKAEKPLQDYILSLSVNQENEPQAIDDRVDEYLQYLIENQNKSTGINSGYPIYDSVIGGGFRKGTVNVVAARLKHGKSTFAINICNYIASVLKYKVLNADTEMQKEDHVNKSLGIFSGVDIRDIETGLFDKDQYKKQKVIEASKKIKELDKRYKRVSVSGKSIEEIISIMRRWVLKDVGYDEKKNIDNCLIIFDYLKIMEANELKSMAEYQLLGLYMTALHNFAKELNVPILCFTQINREGIKDTHSGVVSGSDRISWFASSISIFKRKTSEEIAEQPNSGNCKLYPQDARYGPGLEFPDFINFHFNKKTGKITEGKTYSQTIAEQKGFEITDNKS